MSFESAKKNWEGLAQRDALWSICTTQGKEGGKWTEEEFFAMGEEEIQLIFEYLQSQKLAPIDWQEALDFGCGVGRLSRALSSRFAKVTGIDVSSTMVEKATALHQNHKGQLDFVHNTRPDLSLLADARFSFVYTTIVLQHIPYPASLSYIREMIRILKPGGLLVFQVPTRDLRQQGPIQKLKSWIKIRERLALIGIGKGYHMAMYPIQDPEVKKTVSEAGGHILAATYTNHTDPNFNGHIQFFEKEEECTDYGSRLFVVSK